MAFDASTTCWIIRMRGHHVSLNKSKSATHAPDGSRKANNSDITLSSSRAWYLVVLAVVAILLRYSKPFSAIPVV